MRSRRRSSQHRNTLLTNDTPFQIHDFDGDGKNEVVMVRDFQIQLLEGATGKVLKRVWMPPAPVGNKGQPYELNSGDSMIFLNLSGKKGRQEVLLKDRYNTFWVFDNDLKLLWSGTGQTGHYPYHYDFNGDGKDEFVIGFALWNAAGKFVWSHDAEMKDHADAISIGNYTGDPQARPRVYICGSDEGLVVISEDGKLVRQKRFELSCDSIIAGLEAVNAASSNDVCNISLQCTGSCTDASWRLRN